MSKLVHVVCKSCTSKLEDVEIDPTESHAGRFCCHCDQKVGWSQLIHRHPDAVPCRGIHVRLRNGN